MSALTYKAQENEITILDDLNFDAIKTKNFVELRKSLNVTGKKTLFVIPEENNTTYLSARNINEIKVISAEKLNTYDILKANQLVIAEGAIEKIENLFNS